MDRILRVHSPTQRPMQLSIHQFIQPADIPLKQFLRGARFPLAKLPQQLGGGGFHEKENFYFFWPVRDPDPHLTVGVDPGFIARRRIWPVS